MAYRVEVQHLAARCVASTLKLNTQKPMQIILFHHGQKGTTASLPPTEPQESSPVSRDTGELLLVYHRQYTHKLHLCVGQQLLCI